MKKVFLAVLLIGIVAASASNAASYKGKWGFSLADKEHPIGFDFGLGEKAALDLGVGFRTVPVDTHLVTSGSDVQKKLDWDAQLGLRSAMMTTDNANIFVRVSATYGQHYADPDNPTATTFFLDNKVKRFTAGLELGGEWWPTSILSFHVRHGVRFVSNKPDVAGATSETSFGSTGEVAGDAGFTLWWGGGNK